MSTGGGHKSAFRPPQLADDGPHAVLVRMLTKNVPVIVAGGVSNVKAVVDRLVTLAAPRDVRPVYMDLWVPCTEVGSTAKFERRSLAVVSVTPPQFKVCTPGRQYGAQSVSTGRRPTPLLLAVGRGRGTHGPWFSSRTF